MRPSIANWQIQGSSLAGSADHVVPATTNPLTRAQVRRLRSSRIAGSAVLAACLLAFPSLAHEARATVINLASPDSLWNPIIFALGNPNDFSDDHQTGVEQSDIVGNPAVPGAMWRFDGSGTPSQTDGDIAFRIRLGSSNGGKSYFGGIALFGVDVNLDAKIDTYLAAGRSGNSDFVWIANPGTGLNTSPSTSTFDLGNAWKTYAAVTGPTGNLYYARTTDGIDVDGAWSGPDWYFAFQLPFQDLVTQLSTRLGIGITENTPLSFVVATTNQQNNLNQDIGGIDNNTANLNQTWTALGAITAPSSPSGTNPLLWLGNTSTEWSTNVIAPNKNWTSNAAGVNNEPFTNLTLRLDFTAGDAVTFNDKALNYDQSTGNSTTVNISVANVTPSSVNIDNNSLNYVFQGAYGIAGATSVVKTGTGTATFANTNTYTGGTIISGGILQANNGGALGSGTVSIGSATLALAGSGSYTLANNVGLGTPGSTIAVSNTSPVTLSGSVQDISGTGTGALTKTGSGTLILVGNSNAWSGSTTISAGTIQVGAGGTTGTLGTGAIVNNGTLAINRSDNVGLSSPISGTGNLVQMGTAILSLTANNTYSGTTTISSGALSVGNGGTTGTLGTGAVVNNGELGFNRSNTLIVANTIGGTGSVTQAGTGTTVLTANNTYSGGTLIQHGALQVGLGGPTGSLGSGNIVNDSILAWNRSDAVTVSNNISGSGSFTKMGTNTLTLTGTNSWTGSTTIVGGTLEVGGSGSLGIGSYAGSISNAGTLLYNSMTNQVMSGPISGTGVVVKSNSATLTLSGSSTYSGGTSVTGGILRTGSIDALGSGLVSVSNTGKLDLAGRTIGNDVTLKDTTTNSGAIINSGTGAIGVDNLALGHQGTVDTNGATFTVAGNMVGSGTVTGDMTLGGNLDIGNSGTGLVTVTGNMSTSATTISTFEIAGRTDHDTLHVGGQLILDGLVSVVALGFDTTTLVAGDSFDLLNFSSLLIGASGFDINTDLDLSSMPLGPNLNWNKSRFLTTGTISVISMNVVPEPSGIALVLGIFSLAALNSRRRRRL